MSDSRNQSSRDVAASDDIQRLFAEAWKNEDLRFEAKAQEVAVQLAAAVRHAGINQADLAKKLGWKASRVSKVLTGNGNLTLRTIQQVAEAAGLEFDVILRSPSAQRPAQPWEMRDAVTTVVQGATYRAVSLSIRSSRRRSSRLTGFTQQVQAVALTGQRS